tara:strand:+ start:33616 stop:33957 length:342 start_codon:yes stop_codon:yes gene_type:complete
MPRYKYTTKFNNNIEFYEFLRKKRRNVKNIVQYETPIMHNPSLLQRMNLTTDTHIWAYGDRFYNLANVYYGNVKYWWVIAWYNGYPTEASVYPGDVIEIPIELEEALDALEAY